MSNQPWYMYNIVVPFGNSHFDVGLGGSHDMDIGAPPNYPVTALLPGTVCDIPEPQPSWGKQLGLHLDTPYNGIPYMAYLHLSAINPVLAMGHHVNIGDVIGWVGGATNEAQYAGTSNPTGANFLNDVAMSSRVQVGIALMRGPVYGNGAGWETFPPIDTSLDPTPIIETARQKFLSTPVLPHGWTDDGKHLTAPNGHYFRDGFRLHVLAHNCEEAYIPLQEEQGLSQLEGSNPGLGGGSRQVCQERILEWTQERGVFEAWGGQELLWREGVYADIYKAYQQLKQSNPQAAQQALAQIKSIVSSF